MTAEKRWKFFGSFCIVKSWHMAALISMATFFQGMIVNGLVNVNLATLQKRFKFHSQV